MIASLKPSVHRLSCSGTRTKGQRNSQLAVRARLRLCSNSFGSSPLVRQQLRRKSQVCYPLWCSTRYRRSGSRSTGSSLQRNSSRMRRSALSSRAQEGNLLGEELVYRFPASSNSFLPGGEPIQHASGIQNECRFGEIQPWPEARNDVIKIRASLFSRMVRLTAGNRVTASSAGRAYRPSSSDGSSRYLAEGQDRRFVADHSARDDRDARAATARGSHG